MLVPLTPFVWSMLQVTLLASIALLISWALRGRRPQWTSAMLAGASLAALFLTTLVWLPISHWSVAELTQGRATAFLVSEPRRSDNAQLSNADNRDPQNEDAASEPVAESQDKATMSPSSWAVGSYFSSTASWLSINLQGLDTNLRDFELHAMQRSMSYWRLQMLCMATIIILGGLWLHSWLWIRSIVRHSLPIDDDQAVVLMKTLAERMRLSRAPQLLESNKVAIGATVGARRQRLILNAGWREWTQEELEVVLLHEMAHMVRHDYAWVVLGSWIRMLLFYHPLIHALVRRWRMEQELAADQLAAGAMQSARAYGRALARLALRAQGGAKVPGPALTAEQICIVRRITMLKQGSLKPLKSGARRSALVIALTIMVTAPLSSLRGTPPSAAQPVATETTAKVDKPTDSDKHAEMLARRKEFDAAQKEFPPLSYVGRLKWEPGRLLKNDVSPSLRYLQDLVAFVLFEQFPEKGTIQAPATVTLNWETRAREHGRLTFGATCDESQGIDPQFIMRMLTNPRFTNYKPSSEKKMIAGRQATRLIAQGINPETGVVANDADPNHWFVQDGDSFHFGTEQELLNQFERKETTNPDTRLIEIPEDFRSDFADSAFALVYDDCEQWGSRLRDYLTGSSQQAQLILIQPYLKGLQRVGIFLTGERGATVNIRIGYTSEAAAKDGAEAVDALLGLIKATASSDPNDQFTIGFLNGMVMRTVGSEVRLSFNDEKYVATLCQMILPDEFTGWTDILSLVEASDVPGAVHLMCKDHFALTGFLAQSIQAKDYRGQRIRISAEIGGSEDVHSRCGTIVWASDNQLRTVGNATSGKTIGTPTDTEKVLSLWSQTKDETIVWHTRTVEWNVPDNAEALSFGVYLAAGEVQVRNMKFEVVGPATSDVAETELAKLPRNLMQIPGRKLLEQPTNLDFSEKPASTDSAGTKTAERETVQR